LKSFRCVYEKLIDINQQNKKIAAFLVARENQMTASDKQYNYIIPSI
jgi:hypothetical protein